MASCSDIAGFYRDPSTGRYYRDKDEENNASLRKLKLQKEHVHNLRRKPKLSNVSNFLNDRALGGFSGLQSECKYYEMKFLNKTLRVETDLNSPICRMKSVEFVKGGYKSIFGLWNSADDDSSYVLGESALVDTNPNKCLGFIPNNTFIQDICEVSPKTVLFIYNDFDGNGKMELVWRNYAVENSYEFLAHFDSSENPLYCCSVVDAPGNFQMAVGGENKLTFYHGVAPIRTFEDVGRVMTTSLDKTATLIISGRSDGSVQLFDTRDEQIGHRLSLQVENGTEKCLVDSKYLSEEKVILTGVSNDLYIMDLRNQKRVTSFLGHKHSLKKSAMSLTDEVLCVNGADNVIRIWPMCGGLPLHEIRPPTPETKIRGWLESDANKNLLYYFENSTRKVFNI